MLINLGMMLKLQIVILSPKDINKSFHNFILFFLIFLFYCTWKFTCKTPA